MADERVSSLLQLFETRSYRVTLGAQSFAVFSYDAQRTMNVAFEHPEGIYDLMAILRAARTPIEDLGRTQVDFEQVFLKLIKAPRVFNVLLANLCKVATEMRHYLPNTISMVVTFYAIFLMSFLEIQVLGTPKSAATNTQYVIVSTAL